MDDWSAGKSKVCTPLRFGIRVHKDARTHDSFFSVYSYDVDTNVFLFRAPKLRQPLRCDIVQSARGRILTNVIKTMVIPLPIGVGGVFSEESTGFDDWSVPEGISASDLLPQILRKIFLMTLISLEQKDIGTPALIKHRFLSKKKWADYDNWIYPTKSRSFKCMNKEAFAPNSIDGTVVYDKDVANHFRFLDKETRHLPPTPKPKAGVVPQNNPADPIPPAPSNPDKTLKRFKYHTVLQPCRSTVNPDDIGGFLLWVFIEDPNYNMDAARGNFINGVKRHRAQIEARGNVFPGKTCPLSDDLVNAIKEMKVDDKTMLSVTHKDWMQWCNMYNLAVRTASLNNGDSEADEEDDDHSMDGSSEEDEDDEEDDVEAKLLSNYEDDLSEPSEDSSCSFFSVFTREKAFAIANMYKMDVEHAATCIFSNPDTNDPKTMNIYLKPSVSPNCTTEPSVIGPKCLHPFDNQYYLTQEYCFWSNSSRGTGFKYCNFPWSNSNSNPIYKRVVLKLPPKYAFKASALNMAINCGNGSISMNELNHMASENNRGRQQRGQNKRPRPASSELSGDSMDEESDSRDTSTSTSGSSSTTTTTMTAAQQQRMGRKTKMARKNTYVATDVVQQMALSSGLNIGNLSINGCKIFQDPEMDPSLAGGVDHVSFRFSPTAEKDDVHKVIETHRGWKSSIHAYSEFASLDMRPPKSKAGAVAWAKERKVIRSGDMVIYETTDFVNNYNEALMNYEKTACESLFRVFKKGSESVMTAAVTRLSNFYFQNIHNNVQPDLLYSLHCHQTDFEESLFSSYVKIQSTNLRYVCEIISNFKEFHVIYYGVLDVYRIGDDTHFNYIGSGEGGVGKSFLLELLKTLMVEDTVRSYYMGSEKCEFTDLSRSDDIITADELPPNMAGRQAGNNDKHGHTMEASVNATKTAMSTGMSVYEVFEFLDFGNGDTGRINRQIKTPCVCSRVVVTNNQVVLDKAMRDRCHKASFVNHSSSGELPSSHSKDAGYKRNPLGEQHPEDEYSKLTVLDLKTQMKTQNDSEFKRVQLGYSVFQTLHMIVEKMIGVGSLPKPDMTVGNLIFNKVCKYVKTRSDIDVGMRSHGRIINEIRTMLITDAINNVFFSCCRDREVINEKTLLCLKPYLFSQVHHAVFAITLLMDQIFDPYFNCVLYAAIKRCGKFPVKQWIDRLNEKRQINRAPLMARISRNNPIMSTMVQPTTAAAVSAFEEEEEELDLSLSPIAGPVVPLTGPLSTTNMDVEEQQGGGEIIDVDVDADAHIAPQMEQEQSCDILRSIYIEDYVDNNQCTIQWRTHSEEQGEKNDNNRQQRVKLINLNYIELTTNEVEVINNLIRDNMSPKLGASDVSALLSQMKNTRIKVSGAPKPLTHDDIINPNFSGKLPCYEDKHEFSVLEHYVSTTGGKSHKWCFCVHILTDLNNGESLIMDAIRSISYAGFEPRRSLLTGFVQSFQKASLRSESIEPNPDVPYFSAKNASYRDDSVRKQLGFNDCLLSIKNGHKTTLKDAMDQQDPIYTKNELRIEEDLDVYGAREWALKCGMPIVWVRTMTDNEKREVIIADAGADTDNDEDADCVVKSTRFDPSELKLKWKFLRSDGKVEIRDLPTEKAQRVRNLYWIKQDALPGIRGLTEESFPIGTEWSTLDEEENFSVKIYPS